MSLANVHEALTIAVKAVVGSTPLQRQNAQFAKPANSKWAAFFFLPNQPLADTLGDSGMDMATGIIQVDYYYPAGSGDVAADTDLEAFRAAFKAGHGAIHDGQAVIYRNCGAPHRRQEDNWFIVSVTVGWYALVPR